MAVGYSALPNPRSQPEEDEMEAAFEGSDDEDDHELDASESHPLNPSRPSESDDGEHVSGSFTSAPPPQRVAPRSSQHSSMRIVAPGPASYDFENVDYDFPPPGSPPRRDRALPGNDWGNTNGFVPNEPAWKPRPRSSQNLRGAFGWIRRILPGNRSGQEHHRAYGGGDADGVFANLTAKPAVPQALQDDPENGIYVQPEDAQKDFPPSYQTAQADAVPPYWETTIHAPSSLSPGMMIPGELPIDGLATGTLFSFLWNMLVSISFQFIGFLLTYLLHTTHGAKLGARAGLGLTLVQYGLAFKAGRDDLNAGGGSNDNNVWEGWQEDSTPEPIPTFGSGAEADAWFSDHPNATVVPTQQGIFAKETTTEYVSFLLMAVGWFILLNSLLSFWRIKRLEKSILASHEENPDRTPPVPTTTGRQGHGRNSSFAVAFERTLGLRLPTLRPFNVRDFVSRNNHIVNDYGFDDFYANGPGDATPQERRSVDIDEIRQSVPRDHPERERLVSELVGNERRLQQDLRAAGLL